MIVLWSMILIKKVHLNQNKLEKILWGISHEIGGNQLIFKNQMLIRLRLRKKKSNTIKTKLKMSANHIVGFYKNIITNE